MNYPIKLQVMLTQLCHDLNNANDVDYIAHLNEVRELFEINGYAFPDWLNAWAKQIQKSPLLNAEEHFKKPQEIKSVYKEMSRRGLERSSLEILKINSAVSSICPNSNSALRNALFTIASQILSDSTTNRLSSEWHCKTDEVQSLENRNNYDLFVFILKRETKFWQEDVKVKNSAPPKLKSIPSKILNNSANF